MIDRNAAYRIALNNSPFIKAILCVENKIEEAAKSGYTRTWFGPLDGEREYLTSEVKEEMIRRGFSVTSEIKMVSFRGIGKTGTVLTIKWGIDD